MCVDAIGGGGIKHTVCLGAVSGCVEDVDGFLVFTCYRSVAEEGDTRCVVLQAAGS